jgi:hypothetical protein
MARVEKTLKCSRHSFCDCDNVSGFRLPTASSSSTSFLSQACILEELRETPTLEASNRGSIGPKRSIMENLGRGNVNGMELAGIQAAQEHTKNRFESTRPTQQAQPERGRRRERHTETHTCHAERHAHTTRRDTYRFETTWPTTQAQLETFCIAAL